MPAARDDEPMNPTEDDYEYEPEDDALVAYERLYETDLIRAKGIMDDASTLSEAADQLIAVAEELRALERDGWQLNMPVRDDYGTIERQKQS